MTRNARKIQPSIITDARVGSDWQRALQQAYRDPRQLLSDLAIAAEAIDWLAPDAGEFAMRVPRGFAARMRSGDPDDPLLLQVLPRRREREAHPDFVADPLEESSYHATPGLIHKYAGRALLITTAACGVHCRYCFRREFPYADARDAQDGWGPALRAIAADASITEVILSGGDPLSLADAKLDRLISALEAIPHLRRLRLHSRQPVVLPERVTPALAARLQQTHLQCVIVVHCNHPNEIDTQVADALGRLRATGATLLNQAVLLKGVNDNADALARLSLALFEHQVLPYYLHRLDPVAGAAHFQVADDVAHGIMQSLNATLPGYLVPRLVREVPGAAGKLPEHW